MRYRLLFIKTAIGEEREYIVPSNLPLEDLSPKIKVGLQLPYCDYGWHRFLSQGTTYVIKEHLIAEPEMRFECNLFVGRYRCSEWIRLKNVFTVLGSVITYIQEGPDCDKFKIRITLIERI